MSDCNCEAPLCRSQRVCHSPTGSGIQTICGRVDDEAFYIIPSRVESSDLKAIAYNIVALLCAAGRCPNIYSVM
jgi:hypothetical protein